MMKNLLKYKLVLILFLFSINTVSAQYNMNVKNGVLVNSRTIEFDVFINTENADIEITSYQCAFSLNQEMLQNNNVSFNYIPSSSELSNPPAHGIGCSNFDGNLELHFASTAGSDIISTTETKVGRFRISFEQNIPSLSAIIGWNFEGSISTILTDENFANITTPDKHFGFTLTSNSNNPDAPIDYSLNQNYPNPFNPSTKIKFSLPSQNNVKLSIFNSVGEQVAVLTDEIYDTGIHEVTFNANNIASGVYFYRIETSDFIEVKKMILLK